MEQHRARIRCDNCETWVSVEGGSENVTCDCGERFVVTVTRIPARLV